MIYNAQDGTSGMESVEAFLELWLEMTFLELWLRMESKHVAILGYGLLILVTSVSVRVVAHMEGLHLIGQSQVVANGVANLVSRVRIVVRIENST